MTFHIITLFPNAFGSYLGESILKRAIEDGKIKVKFYNPRDFVYPERSRGAKKKQNRRIDRAPYGGGPGMVIQAEPVIRAITKAHSNILQNVRMKSLAPSAYRLTPRTIWLTPRGKQFTNETAIKYAKKYTDLIIVCGRYEGIDARVKKVINSMRINEWVRISRIEEVSVGPFVLTGGELAAEILIDVIARQVPGVLGDPESREETRVASPDVYTRPEVFTYCKKQYRVPKILLTGHHANIEKWRKKRLG